MISVDIRDQLLRQFSDAGVSGPWVLPDDIADASAALGAYIVCLHLPSIVEIALPRLPNSRLASGWYFYVGSARGTGGIRARLKRHLQPTKRLHWHIDRLTVKADQIAALALVDDRECELVDKLLKSGRFSIPVAGFGSSDCRRCASHLLSRKELRTHNG